MAELVERLQNIQLPPHQLRELGLDKDWNKKVSPDFVERVVKTADKYKDVLRELSKK